MTKYLLVILIAVASFLVAGRVEAFSIDYSTEEECKAPCVYDGLGRCYCRGSPSYRGVCSYTGVFKQGFKLLKSIEAPAEYTECVTECVSDPACTFIEFHETESPEVGECKLHGGVPDLYSFEEMDGVRTIEVACLVKDAETCMLSINGKIADEVKGEAAKCAATCHAHDLCIFYRYEVAEQQCVRNFNSYMVMVPGSVYGSTACHLIKMDCLVQGERYVSTQSTHAKADSAEECYMRVATSPDVEIDAWSFNEETKQCEIAIGGSEIETASGYYRGQRCYGNLTVALKTTTPSPSTTTTATTTATTDAETPRYIVISSAQEVMTVFHTVVGIIATLFIAGL